MTAETKKLIDNHGRWRHGDSSAQRGVLTREQFGRLPAEDRAAIFAYNSDPEKGGNGDGNVRIQIDVKGR